MLSKLNYVYIDIEFIIYYFIKGIRNYIVKRFFYNLRVIDIELGLYCLRKYFFW